MEPSKTPSNEDLEIKIDVLKARVVMLEAEVQSWRDIASIGYQRCMKWDAIQDRSINRLWLMFFLVACAITLQGLGHILTNWGK